MNIENCTGVGWGIQIILCGAMNARTEKINLTGCHAASKIAGWMQLVKIWEIAKMKHTVKYWDKKLLSLQRLADSVGYDIDSDADYIAACACQPATFIESSRIQEASPEILTLFYNVVERVQSVKNCK